MIKNVGDCDAYLRISIGLSLFGFGILKKSKLMIAIGSMKVAEGLTRWCPMLYLADLYSNCKDKVICKEN